MPTPPDKSNRPNYKDRQAHRRLIGWLKFYVAAIVIGGICGVAFLKRAELKNLYDQSRCAPAPTVAPAPEKTVEKKIADAQPAPRKEAAVKPAPATPQVIEGPKALPKMVVLPQDQLRARKLLDDGRSLLTNFEFQAAAQRFTEASSLKAGEDLVHDAQLSAQKAAEFQNAVGHIQPAEFAVSDKAVAIETVDGNEWQGLKLREDNEKIYLQAVPESNPASEGKQIFPIPKNEIRTSLPLKLNERQLRFAQVLHAAEAATSVADSSDLYDLVYLARRLGLNKECLAYLNRAFDGGTGNAPDPHVGDSFRQVVIGRAMGRAALLMAANRVTQTEFELKRLKQTLPAYAAVDQEIAAFRTQVMSKVTPDYKSTVTISESKPVATAAKRGSAPAIKPRAEESIEVAEDNSGVKGSGPAAAIVDKANAKFSEAMNIVKKYKAGLAGNKNDNNRFLNDAKQLFNDAIDEYEQALKLEPGNKAIENRQKEASMLVYFCMKNFIMG